MYQVDVAGPRDLRDVHGSPQGRDLQHHPQGPDVPGVAHVLAGAHQVFGRQPGKRRHLFLDHRVRLQRCRVPGVGEVLGVETVEVGNEHYVVAFRGGGAEDHVLFGHGAHYGNLYGIEVAVRMGMPPYYGHVELLNALFHAAQYLVADLGTLHRDDIHHRNRPPSHRGYIVHVDEDCKISGVKRIRSDQRAHYAIGCEQKVVFTIVYRGGVLALGGEHLREIFQRQKVDYLVDRVLSRNARKGAYGTH